MTLAMQKTMAACHN